MIILITGKPGTGKSTVIEKFLKDYTLPMSWILTKEIRNDSDERVGFKALNSSGKENVISHKFDIDSEIIIGANKVDLPKIDQFFTEEIRAIKPEELLAIDEIGPIQLLSKNFERELDKLFQTNSNLLATIHFNDKKVDKYKNDKKTILIEVTEENRDLLPTVLLNVLENINYLNNLSDARKSKVFESTKIFAKEGNLMEIRKLYKNTLKYLDENRIKKIDDNTFEVLGDHGTYTVKKEASDFSCTCDLFLGKGNYKKSGECSHIQAVKIF